MKVKYEGEELQFDLEDITVAQATVLKRRLGLTLIALDKGLNEGDPDALRAVYWLMQEQNGKKVDLDNVDFKVVKFANAVAAAIEEEAREEEAAAAAAGEAPKEKE